MEGVFCLKSGGETEGVFCLKSGGETEGVVCLETESDDCIDGGGGGGGGGGKSLHTPCILIVVFLNSNACLKQNVSHPFIHDDLHLHLLFFLVKP